MSYAALPSLRTPRLTLRPLTENDADAIVDGVGNYDVSRWLGVVPYPYARDDALRFIEDVTENAKSVWGVCTDNRLIGTVSLENQLGYWIARGAWRKGFGFEAAQCATAHWFDDPANGDLYSNYFYGNDRSRAVMQALGFRDHSQRTTFAKALNQDVTSYVMSLSRADWDKRMAFRIKTKRLLLRPYGERDVADFAAMTVPDVTRMMGQIPTGMTVDEARADVDRRTWRGYLGFTIAIEYQGKMIGTLGIGGAPFSVGFFLHPDHWGKGIMPEALSAFLKGVFERFPMAQITADHFEDNPASGSVLRKCGFERTGTEMSTSLARLEPAPAIHYAISREKVMGGP